ncbi:MAG: hypothetical protein IJG57_04560 [Firmicutes bacterium]|nr:hypothetical protein [Bacillota bacterium]
MLLIELAKAIGLLVIIGIGIFLITKFVKPHQPGKKKKKKAEAAPAAVAEPAAEE